MLFPNWYLFQPRTEAVRNKWEKCEHIGKVISQYIGLTKLAPIISFENEFGYFLQIKWKALSLLKTVAFIAGKKNPADQNFYICFSIEIKALKMIFKGEIASKIQFRPT